MTPDELAHIGRTLFGPRWQSALARAFGLKLRTVQRWAAGTSRIAPDAANDFRRALEIRWTVGTSPLRRWRQRVSHYWFPRFHARVVWTDADGLPTRKTDKDADLVGGITWSDGDDLVLCEFVWLDKPPVGEDYSRLMEQAAAAARQVPH